MSDFIKKNVPYTELLAGLAEECSELAQAALKLRRVLDPEQKNPTPKKEEEAIEDLYEEIADVKLYIKTLALNTKYISELMERKQTRWEKRLSSCGR